MGGKDKEVKWRKEKARNREKETSWVEKEGIEREVRRRKKALVT